MTTQDDQAKHDNPWKKAKVFHIFGYRITVLKADMSQPYRPRRYYTELHKDDYLASMGSDMPTHWLAALETYLKRKRIV